MADLSDDALLDSANRGDRDALAELLRRCAPPLRAKMAAQIDPVWRASIDEDDLLQVTYIEVFEGLKSARIQSVGAFVRWLERTAENNLRDAIRGLTAIKRGDPRRRIESRDGRDQASLELVARLEAHLQTPSWAFAAKEAGQWLRGALRKLPADYRQAVELLDLEQRTPAEAAEAMKRSSGAVHMLRARAHDRLRRMLPSSSSFG
jgi:RNA polymerase sigma factor (sigma-70 family)